MKKIAIRVSEIQARLRDLHSTLEKEKRAMTDEERSEVKALEREQDLLLLQSRALSLPNVTQTRAITVKDMLRAIVNGVGTAVELRIREEGSNPTNPTQGTTVTETINHMMSTDLPDGALMPLKVGDIVKPLRENLIYDKIGIQLPTGCRGNYEWPVVEAIKATIAGEGVKVGPTKIDLDKVATVTQRIAVVVEATRESLFNSDGKLEGIIREQMPLAIAETVNQILTSTTKVNDKCAITGPFVGLTATAVDFTFKGLNLVKAGLLAKNVRSDRMCWVMTESTKAELEATPKDTGSGIMLVENDRLCGLPIFCSSHIGEGNIGLGDFTYQVCGQFGDFYMVVDPYTGADSNMVRFVLNTNFGTAKLRPEAFTLVKKKTS